MLLLGVCCLRMPVVISSPQCAFAAKGMEGVDLWCEVLETTDEAIKFNVINGEWRGMFKDGRITFLDGRWMKSGWVEAESLDGFDAELVWHGSARFRRDEYNEALAWIEEQIRPKEPFDPIAMGYAEIDFAEVERAA
jgi:hypothetical protein